MMINWSPVEDLYVDALYGIKVDEVQQLLNQRIVNNVKWHHLDSDGIKPFVLIVEVIEQHALILF